MNKLLRFCYRLSTAVIGNLHRALSVGDEAWVISESRRQPIHPYLLEALSIASWDIHNVKVTTENPPPGKLKGFFTKFGSDKETTHSYEGTYSKILAEKEFPRILEIGLGSKNAAKDPRLPNRYRFAGEVGASVKAWKEALPNCEVVGADIDLAAVNSIKGFGTGIILDQNSEDSLNNFVSVIKNFAPFDLIIDDGFHYPNANLRTLRCLLEFVSLDGSYVIEDVQHTDF